MSNPRFPSMSRSICRSFDLLSLVWSTAILALVMTGAAAVCAANGDGTQTERRFLSGTGLGDAVAWDFRCSEGRGCGEWTSIAVPSQWELQGFGIFDYGYRDEQLATEEGDYRHVFQVPDHWRGRRVALVFDGVMTDAWVRVNGQVAGPEHRGGFTRFEYDVTDLVAWGAENQLEVRVRKHSLDDSVNRAEREADYWIFGGIYRPVYLRADPSSSIDTVAIDARHGGDLRIEVSVNGGLPGDRVTARVHTRDDVILGDALTGVVGPVSTGDVPRVVLEGTVPDARSWSAETPVRHRLALALERGGVARHVTTAWFGFRTIELRPDAGLFVNGRRVMLKGFNRHAFWPMSGRTLNAAVDRRDVELMLAMNANAVRASHYPPDPAFLEACDTLGLYVINELPGWKEAYDTDVGRGLVHELVERDRNHPSILFWANGNEGGWNTELDAEFTRHDPQRRPVLHPEEVASGVDTVHYPTYRELREHLESGPPASSWWRRLISPGRDDEPLPLVMPTEMLHGLYDGGGGAGLAAYWTLLRDARRGVGGFLWSLFDEGVARGDRGWRLDTAGNLAPDGVVGPERVPEGSFHAIRAIWSPVIVEDFTFAMDAARALTADVTVANRFDHTDLGDTTFTWQWLRLPDVGVVTATGVSGLTPVGAGGRMAGPVAPPGGVGTLRLPARHLASGLAPDVLRLTIFDTAGRERMVWMLPTQSPSAWVRARLGETPAIGVVTTEDDPSSGDTVLRVGDKQARLAGALQTLAGLGTGSVTLPLAGPLPLVDGVGTNDVFASTEWTLMPSGWLRLRYQLRPREGSSLLGLWFDYPRERVRSVRWLGGGPSPVWGNRREGPRLGVWSRVRSGAVGGAPAFAGFHDDVHWAEFETEDGCLQVALETDSVALGFYNPAFGIEPETATAILPADGITVLHTVPSIGTKFHRPEMLEPTRRAASPTEPVEGVVWLRVTKACGG